MNNDVDDLQLSASTLAALQEFYAEQDRKFGDTDVDEDWDHSQFWYSPKTAAILASECRRLAEPAGKVACVSSPTIFKQLLTSTPKNVDVVLFEFDRRFEKVFGERFAFYDFNEPTSVADTLLHTFDIVVADPPFLSEDCLTKTAETVKLLAKEGGKIILCTGAIMELVAKRTLDVEPCKFRPRHANKLCNEFKCYVNYPNSILDFYEEEEEFDTLI